MQTRVYDSAESGPPHGWLKCGYTPLDTEDEAWKKTATEAIQALQENHRDSRESGELIRFPQFWGAFHLDERYWVYRILPSGRDRLGRPGRTMTALFCLHQVDDLDWALIARVSLELESLPSDTRNLSGIRSILDGTDPKSSLADEFLGSKFSNLMPSIPLDLKAALKGLEMGWHYSMSIQKDGTVIQRANIAKPDARKNNDAIQSTPVPARPPHKVTQHNMMNKEKGRFRTLFTHTGAFVVGLAFGGLAVGFVFGKNTPPKPDLPPSEPKYQSVDEAIKSLRLATDSVEEWKRKAQDRHPSQQRDR